MCEVILRKFTPYVGQFRPWKIRDFRRFDHWNSLRSGSQWSAHNQNLFSRFQHRNNNAHGPQLFLSMSHSETERISACRKTTDYCGVDFCQLKMSWTRAVRYHEAEGFDWAVPLKIAPHIDFHNVRVHPWNFHAVSSKILLLRLDISFWSISLYLF